MPNKVFVQITFVQPCADDCGDEAPRTEFTSQNRVREFMFETPFTKGGAARGALMEQFTRKTYLSVKHGFPFIRSRQEVLVVREEVRTPLEGAIETIKARAATLDAVAKTRPVNIKLLQLQLQVPIRVTRWAPTVTGDGERVCQRGPDRHCRGVSAAGGAGQHVEPRPARRPPQGQCYGTGATCFVTA